MRDNVTELQQMEIDELNELYSVLGFDPATMEEGQEIPQRFTINDIEQLNWAFRKIDAYNAKLSAAEALKNAELARINEWFANQSKDLTANINFFEHLIREYGERGRANDSKWKGEKTPYGTLSFTKSQPDWTYADESATIQFLKSDEKLAEHVKTTEAIANKTEIKKVIEIKRNVFVKDGEVVDIAEETPEGWAGMQYMQKIEEVDAERWKALKEIESKLIGELYGNEETGGVWVKIIDLAEDKAVDDVELVDVVAVYAGRVVPGLVITDKPDRINIKGPK